MPQAVIDWVNTMVADQPCLLTFLDTNGVEIMDEETYTDTVEDNTNYKIPGVVGIDAQIPGVNKENAIEDTAVDNIETTVNDMSNKPSTTTEPEPLLVEEDNAAPEITFDTNAESAEPMETPAAVVTPVEPRTNTNVCERPSRTRNKPKSYVPLMKDKSYDYAATQISNIELLSNIEFPQQIVELVLTQVTLKAAMKLQRLLK